MAKERNVLKQQQHDTIVSVRISTALVAKIDARAEREDRTRNWLIVRALEAKYGKEAV